MPSIYNFGSMFVSTVKRLRVLKSSELSALSRKFICLNSNAQLPFVVDCYDYWLLRFLSWWLWLLFSLQQQAREGTTQLSHELKKERCFSIDPRWSLKRRFNCCFYLTFWCKFPVGWRKEKKFSSQVLYCSKDGFVFVYYYYYWEFLFLFLLASCRKLKQPEKRVVLLMHCWVTYNIFVCNSVVRSRRNLHILISTWMGFLYATVNRFKKESFLCSVPLKILRKLLAFSFSARSNPTPEQWMGCKAQIPFYHLGHNWRPTARKYTIQMFLSALGGEKVWNTNTPFWFKRVDQKSSLADRWQWCDSIPLYYFPMHHFLTLDHLLLWSHNNIKPRCLLAVLDKVQDTARLNVFGLILDLSCVNTQWTWGNGQKIEGSLSWRPA